MEEGSTSLKRKASVLESTEPMEPEKPNDTFLGDITDPTYSLNRFDITEKYLNPFMFDCKNKNQDACDIFKCVKVSSRLNLNQQRIQVQTFLCKMLSTSQHFSHLKTFFQNWNPNSGVLENGDVEDMKRKNAEFKVMASSIVIFLRNILEMKECLEFFQYFVEENQSINVSLEEWVTKRFLKDMKESSVL